MKTFIWKWALPTISTTIEMPKHAKILAVQVQTIDGVEVVHLWAQCKPYEPTEKRTFAVRMTGEPIDGYAGEYRGTFQMGSGAYVGHLFETT